MPDPKLVSQFNRETLVSRRDLTELASLADSIVVVETLEEAKWQGKQIRQILRYLETDEWTLACKTGLVADRKAS